MKKSLSFLAILLILGTSVYFFYTHSGEKANQVKANENLVVLETNYKLTVEDIIDAFSITDLFYFRTYGAIYPTLNNVQPRPFHYLDGTLYTYIFNNEGESELGLNEVKKNFSPLIENRPGIDPLIYKANNALVVYVPGFSAKVRITNSMEWLLFLKEAKEERGLSSSIVRGLQNSGYTEQQILNLTQEEIDRALSSRDGEP